MQSHFIDRHPNQIKFWTVFWIWNVSKFAAQPKNTIYEFFSAITFRLKVNNLLWYKLNYTKNKSHCLTLSKRPSKVWYWIENGYENPLKKLQRAFLQIKAANVAYTPSKERTYMIVHQKRACGISFKQGAQRLKFYAN